MTLKCPHCKGLLAVTGVSAFSADPVTPEEDRLVKALQVWTDTPVALSTLLLDYGCEGNLSRFEPLDREVVRTVFRSIDAIRALGLGVPPEHFRVTAQRVPLWSDEAAVKRFFGLQGRWWVKSGYEWAPGFVEVGHDLV